MHPMSCSVKLWGNSFIKMFDIFLLDFDENDDEENHLQDSNDEKFVLEADI